MTYYDTNRKKNYWTAKNITKLLCLLGSAVIALWNSLINAAFFSWLGFAPIIAWVLGILITVTTTYVGFILLDPKKLKRLFGNIRVNGFAEIISSVYHYGTIIGMILFFYGFALVVAHQFLLIPVGLTILGFEAKTVLAIASLFGSEVLLRTFVEL